MELKAMHKLLTAVALVLPLSLAQAADLKIGFVSVAKILIEYDCPEEVVIAGLLLDTVEDTAVSLEAIRASLVWRMARVIKFRLRRALTRLVRSLRETLGRAR